MTAVKAQTQLEGIPPVLWTPTPKQALALACSADEIFFGGAPAGGKTAFLRASFAQHAARYGEAAQGLIVRRTLPELMAFQKAARELYPRLGAQFLAKERSWVFPNGARLMTSYCENMDDATRYLSFEFTWIACDEAGGYKDLAPIFFLQSRLRSPVEGIQKQLLLTGNPGGPGHKTLYERYIKGRQPYVPFRDPDTGLWRVYIPSIIADNPHILQADPGYAQRILSAGPRDLMLKILKGDWEFTPAGSVFKTQYWRYRPILPAPMAVIQSWDTASKAKQRNDRSVCTTWFVYPDAFQLVDCFAERLESPDVKRMVSSLAERWRPHLILIEDASAGTPIIQELTRESTLPVLPVQPVGDKWARACAVAPLIEAGRVYLPDNSPAWLSDFLLETAQFPEGAHDDIVDSVSQALRYLRDHYTFGDGPAYSYESVVTPSANKKAVPKRDDFFTAPDDDDDEESDWRLASGTW